MEEFYLSEDDEVYYDENFRLIEDYKELPYMLFYSLSDAFLMVKYEDELGNINDYVYFNNLNLCRILDEKKEETNLAKNVDKYIEYYGETIEACESNEITWEWLTKKVNKCNNIVLFLSFIEGALKEILDYYAKEKKYVKQIKDRNLSNIEYYINQIGNCTKYDIKSKLEDELEIINVARRIRNIFVHEWNSYYNKNNNEILEKELTKFKITNLINAISKILYFCEYAGVKGRIIRLNNNEIAQSFVLDRIDRIKNEFKDPDILNIVEYYLEKI